MAVTRAREAVSLVASVRSSDMDLSGSTSIGAQLLKAYLEYAEHGVDSMSRSIVETQGNCESPFEEEVAAALIRHGLEPVPKSAVVVLESTLLSSTLRIQGFTA